MIWTIGRWYCFVWFTVIALNALAKDNADHFFALFAAEDESWSSIVEAPDFLAVPLRIVNNLILIEAEVEGQRGSFVLDTGAPYLVLNLTYFRHKYKPGHPLGSAGGITGKGTQIAKAAVDEFNIRQLRYKRLLVDVIPLGHIENSRGVKILGLLGLSLFTEYEVELDIRNAVMFLRKVNRRGERFSNQLGIERVGKPQTISMLSVSNIMAIEVLVQNRKLRFCIDTAAEYSVLSTTNSRQVLAGVTVQSRKRLLGSSAVSTEVLFGELAEIKIGIKTIKKLPVVVTSLVPMSDAFNYHIDGMLGFDFLQRGVVWFNVNKRELSILYHEE